MSLFRSVPIVSGMRPEQNNFHFVDIAWIAIISQFSQFIACNWPSMHNFMRLNRKSISKFSLIKPVLTLWIRPNGSRERKGLTGAGLAPQDPWTAAIFRLDADVGQNFDFLSSSISITFLYYSASSAPACCRRKIIFISSYRPIHYNFTFS